MNVFVFKGVGIELAKIRCCTPYIIKEIEKRYGDIAVSLSRQNVHFMDPCKIPRWQLLKLELRNLKPSEFRLQYAKNPSGVLVDVRTSDEVNELSLPGAIHADYLAEDFLDELEKWDRDCTYFIYCRTGRRSVRTGILMKNWGFQHIINLDGGLAAWQEVIGNDFSMGE